MDRLKEEIGWLKVNFAAFFAVDISIIGWLAQNFHKVGNVIFVAAWLGVIVTTSILAFTSHRVYKLLNHLERF